MIGADCILGAAGPEPLDARPGPTVSSWCCANTCANWRATASPVSTNWHARSHNLCNQRPQKRIVGAAQHQRVRAGGQQGCRIALDQRSRRRPGQVASFDLGCQPRALLGNHGNRPAIPLHQRRKASAGQGARCSQNAHHTALGERGRWLDAWLQGDNRDREACPQQFGRGGCSGIAGDDNGLGMLSKQKVGDRKARAPGFLRPTFRRRGRSLCRRRRAGLPGAMQCGWRGAPTRPPTPESKTPIGEEFMSVCGNRRLLARVNEVDLRAFGIPCSDSQVQAALLRNRVRTYNILQGQDTTTTVVC